MRMSDRVQCDWCLTDTTKEPRHGRRTRRHKCPHGYWCPRSDKLRQHDNHFPMNGQCAECRAAYWMRERARVEDASRQWKEKR